MKPGSYVQLARADSDEDHPKRCVSYMLNTRNEKKNTVFYSYLACFVNTCTLNMYVSMPYTGLIRRNTLFIFLWSRHRNT